MSNNNHNKERIIGSSILLGGGLLLSAVFYRAHYVKTPDVSQQTDITAETVAIQPHKDRSTMGELTADYQTEQRILAQKKQERAARVAQQEKMVKDYLKVQEAANAKALKKADIEFAMETYPSKDEPVVTSKKTPPKTTKSNADVKTKERQALEAKAKKARDQKAKQQKEAKEKREAVLAKKQAEKTQEQQRAQAYAAARKKLKDERAKAVMEGASGNYGVQVAMAGNQTLANDMAAKLKKHGYKVITSQTSRGVRVIVGHEQGKGAAIALKDKVNADKRLGLNGAWVMRLRPEHLKAKKQNTTDVAKAKRAKQKALTEQKRTLKKERLKLHAEKQKQNKLKQTQQQANSSNTEDKTRYGIQVAMAGTTEDADRLIKKLKKHGYKVTTSNTTRGTRIIVGGGLTKEDAKKMQARVNTDSRIGVSGAWMRRER